MRELTDLDVLGVPVFVSVRKRARAEVFTFGKGCAALMPRSGPTWRRLEFFFAEPGWAVFQPAGDLLGTSAVMCSVDDAILDFVPLLQREVDLDAPLLLASVRDLESECRKCHSCGTDLYPAPDVGQSIFGSSTNGLASGNSLQEASIQALLELIERDIWSFEFVRGASKLVDPASLPDQRARNCRAR